MWKGTHRKESLRVLFTVPTVPVLLPFCYYIALVKCVLILRELWQLLSSTCWYYCRVYFSLHRDTSTGSQNIIDCKRSSMLAGLVFSMTQLFKRIYSLCQSEWLTQLLATVTCIVLIQRQMLYKISKTLLVDYSPFFWLPSFNSFSNVSLCTFPPS